MQVRAIGFTATEFDNGVFTIEKVQNGKMIVMYDASRMYGEQCRQFSRCGLVSKLAEISLTVAGETVIGGSTVREMEIEILSEKNWDNLEAVSEILYAEVDSATARSDIRAGRKGMKANLVARAFGTVVRVEKSLSEDKVPAG